MLNPENPEQKQQNHFDLGNFNFCPTIQIPNIQLNENFQLEPKINNFTLQAPIINIQPLNESLCIQPPKKDNTILELNVSDLEDEVPTLKSEPPKEPNKLILESQEIKRTQSYFPVFSSSVHNDELALVTNTSSNHLSQVIRRKDEQIKLLNKLLAAQQKDMQLYQQFIRGTFKSPELLLKQSIDKETLNALTKCFQDKPLVALCFASPLVRFYDSQSGETLRKAMSLLDYAKEFKMAISGLSKTKNAIQVKQVQATLEKFTHILTDNPVGLHFSGHGIENKLDEIGRENFYMQNEGNCLVFETENGSAHYVSEKKLKQLLKTTCKLQFVFVASCHSQPIGQIFYNAGVPHVVCVKKLEEIEDEAAVLFSEAFYELLFKEKLTICQAFELARNILGSNKDRQLAKEAEKLMIIKEKGKHDCTVLGPFPDGVVENLNPIPTFPFEVAKINEFIGRQQEMQEVIQYVLQNRLTTILGMPGIGKTTLAKNVGYFLQERYAFQDGIVYFSMRGQDQTSMLIQQMYLFFSQHRGQREEQIKFQLDYDSMKQKIFDLLNQLQVLLIVDNIEDSLRKDKQNLRDFLQNLLQRLPNLKLLLTSREQIQDLGDFTEKVFQLKELSKNFTIQLLEKKALRPITQQEIDELLSLKLSTKVLFTKPTQKEKKVRCLEDHHLCTLLGGHPHAISLIAPLLQNKNLSELYQMLQKMINSKNFIQNLHDLNPNFSLKVSLDTSIAQMRKDNEKAIELFCLLGLLPGGITEHDLTSIWGSEEWVVLAEHLRNASLLVEKIENQSFLNDGQKKFSLLPFMNKYAEALLNAFDLKQLHERCVNFLMVILKRLFRDSGVEEKRMEQDKLRFLLLDYETNIWSCIYRICDFNKKYNHAESKIAKRMQAHLHHVVGYSSADEYEQFLISDMTTDQENDEELYSLKSLKPKNSKRTLKITEEEEQSDEPQRQQSTEEEGPYDNVDQHYAPSKILDQSITQKIGTESDIKNEIVESNFDKIVSSKRQSTSSESEIIKTQISNIIQFQSQLSKKSKKTKGFAKTSTMLDPIIEQTGNLTKDGLFLITYISVLIIDKKFTDALRGIRHIFENKIPDGLCIANLQKLQGLALMLSRSDKVQDALKCFEHAQKFFVEKCQGNQNIGVAQCLAAQGYIIFNKFTAFTSKGEDESKLFLRASERLNQAREIFKAANHIGGQAYCCSQLGVIYKKLKKNYITFFEEKMTLKKALMAQKSQWIPRYEGEELSLLIETVDKQQLGLQSEQKLKIQHEIKKEVQSKISISSFKNGQIKKQASPIKDSSEDESTAKIFKRKAVLQTSSTTTKKNSEKFEQAKKRREDAELQKKQKLEEKLNRNVQKPNLKNSKEKDQKAELGELRTDQQLLQSNFHSTTDFQVILVEPQELPISVQAKELLNYQWVYRLVQGDTVNTTNNYQEFDFKSNWQIEDYYQQMIGKGFPNNVYLTLKGQKNHKGENSQYIIRVQQNREFQTVHEILSTDDIQAVTETVLAQLVQENVNTKFKRQILKIDKSCPNPDFKQDSKHMGDEILDYAKNIATSVASTVKQSFKDLVNFKEEADETAEVLQSGLMESLPQRQSFIKAPTFINKQQDKSSLLSSVKNLLGINKDKKEFKFEESKEIKKQLSKPKTEQNERSSFKSDRASNKFKNTK